MQKTRVNITRLSSDLHTNANGSCVLIHMGGRTHKEVVNNHQKVCTGKTHTHTNTHDSETRIENLFSSNPEVVNNHQKVCTGRCHPVSIYTWFFLCLIWGLHSTWASSVSVDQKHWVPASCMKKFESPSRVMATHEMNHWQTEHSFHKSANPTWQLPSIAPERLCGRGRKQCVTAHQVFTDFILVKVINSSWISPSANHSLVSGFKAQPENSLRLKYVS